MLNNHNTRQNVICTTCEHRSSDNTTEDTSYVITKNGENYSDVVEDDSELVEDQITLE